MEPQKRVKVALEPTELRAYTVCILANTN